MIMLDCEIKSRMQFVGERELPQDDKYPGEVTVKDTLNTPKIVFTHKVKMCDTAYGEELSIDRDTVTKAGSGTGGKGGSLLE